MRRTTSARSAGRTDAAKGELLGVFFYPSRAGVRTAADTDRHLAISLPTTGHLSTRMCLSIGPSVYLPPSPPSTYPVICICEIIRDADLDANAHQSSRPHGDPPETPIAKERLGEPRSNLSHATLSPRSPTRLSY